MSRSLLLILAGAVLFTLSSCSFGYQKRWQKAADSAQTSQPHDLSGAWQGTWLSESSGHHGKLRSIVTVLETSPKQTRYLFHYHATFAGFLSGAYKSEHTATEKDGKLIITGEQNLGKLLGGVYRYDGTATPQKFKATYTSKMDQGVFEMQRP